MAILLPSLCDAQLFRGSNYWRQYRREVGFGIGASNFLGELGGRDQIGSDFIFDLEMVQTKFALAAFYRYYLAKQIAVRGSFYYANVGGDDKLTNEFFRRNRNLHFKSPIVELNAVLELHALTERTGHRYKIKNARGAKGFAFGIYGFGGIGAFYFNPKGFVPGYGWVPLRPLKTEGQGLEGGADPYKRVGICIPYGIGIRTAVSDQGRIALQVGARKTFTDYIDDVSGVYYDSESIAVAAGSDGSVTLPEAEVTQLADPNLGLTPSTLEVGDDAFDETKTISGVQRGDPTDNDAYMFLQLTYTYKISKNKKYGRYKKSRYKSRRRSYGGRRRRSMPSF